MKKPLIVIFIVLLIDQISKFWVKLSMTIGESVPVFGDWFQIYFIENKTYGVCRMTGKLIPKERLRAVPHATLSVEAKMGQKK